MAKENRMAELKQIVVESTEGQIDYITTLTRQVKQQIDQAVYNIALGESNTCQQAIDLLQNQNGMVELQNDQLHSSGTDSEIPGFYESDQAREQWK